MYFFIEKQHFLPSRLKSKASNVVFHNFFLKISIFSQEILKNLRKQVYEILVAFFPYKAACLLLRNNTVSYTLYMN